MIQTRRDFLTTTSLAGAASVFLAAHALAEKGPLETTTVRIYNDPSICIAPARVARDLLRADGFTDIRFVDVALDVSSSINGHDPLAEALARGDIDFALEFPAQYLPAIEAGVPITVLAGLHIGCFELLAQENIVGFRDLRGRTVGLRVAPVALLALMAAQVGLVPNKDFRWVSGSDAKTDPLELFAAGKIDAFLGFPPEPQELRARGHGHVIVSTATDHPWSQYYCCMLAAGQRFVRECPVATKRVLRALLKAADLCASDPARVAHQLVDSGLTSRYDYALQTLNEVPYDRWRGYDPEDTVRFYSLKMHDIGMIRASPQKIIAEGTDWRFLNELREELKI